MEKHCSSCMHYDGALPLGKVIMHKCKISSVISNGKPCKFFNKDVSHDKICYNCEHFLGENGDWGLCCSIHYDKLSHCLDKACPDFTTIQGKEIFYALE